MAGAVPDEPMFRAARFAPGTPNAAFIFGPGITGSLDANPAAVVVAADLGPALPLSTQDVPGYLTDFPDKYLKAIALDD